MFNDELAERVTNTIVNLDERVGELERKETLTSGDGIGPFRYELHVDVNGGGDFLSVKTACDYVAAQDSVGTVEWLIWVHPGDYEESPFTIPEFTTLWGLGATGINGGGASISPVANPMTSGTFITISHASALIGNLYISGSVSPSVGNTYLISGTGERFVVNGIKVSMTVSLAAANAAAAIRLTDASTYEINDATISIGNGNTGALRAIEITVVNSIGNEGFIRGSRIRRTSSTATAIYYDGAGLVPAVPNKLYILETTINPIGTDIHAFSGTILLRATQYTTSTGSGTISQMYTSGTGTGTVTSVAMSVPSFLSVAGSPITTSGTFAVTLATQSANRVFAGPTSGGAVTPTFRALVAADIPNLDASKITTGNFGVSRGAIGITSYTIGDLIYASGATTLSALADVATGNALISGGVGVAPLWDKIGLTTHVSGILPGPNGGTGLGTFAADLMLYSSAIDTWATTAITAFARSVLDDTTAAAARTTLGAIGGSGAATRIPIFSDASTLTSDSRLTFDTATGFARIDGKLGINGAPTTTTFLNLQGTQNNSVFALFANNDPGTEARCGFVIQNRMDGTHPTSPNANVGLTFMVTSNTYDDVLAWQEQAVVRVDNGLRNGLRLSAAGGVCISTSGTGTNDGFWDASGNLGLGTATPGTHLDIFKTTGGIARLSRNDTAIVANDVLGRMEFYGGDSDLSTQNIFGYIEVQAAATITTDAARGKMLFAVTPNTVASSPVVRLTIEEDGRIYGSALHNNAGAVTGTTNQYVASGNYTPTLNNTTNVAASTAYQCQWIRVGNVVAVSGKVDVDPTAAVATVLGISLPIASNFGAVEDCSGTAYSPAVAAQGAAILASVANDRAEMQWIAVDLSNRAMHFSFIYEVI